jgi:hypothetical protein
MERAKRLGRGREFRLGFSVAYKADKIVLLAAGEVCSALSPVFSTWNCRLNILSMIRDHTWTGRQPSLNM